MSTTGQRAKANVPDELIHLFFIISVEAKRVLNEFISGARFFLARLNNREPNCSGGDISRTNEYSCEIDFASFCMVKFRYQEKQLYF